MVRIDRSVPKQPTLTVLVLVGVLGCSEAQPQYARVPMAGADPGKYLGRWYDSQGRLDLLVSEEAGRYTARVRSPPADSGYPRTGLEAVPGGLLISMKTPDGDRQALVKRVELDESSAGGGSTVCLAGEHHVWACHEPGASWLLEVHAQRRFERSMELADEFVDWLVRTL